MTGDDGIYKDLHDLRTFKTLRLSALVVIQQDSENAPRANLADPFQLLFVLLRQSKKGNQYDQINDHATMIIDPLLLLGCIMWDTQTV